MTSRLEVRDIVLDCTNCELCSVGSGPVAFSGPTPARVVVLGEAPGKDEDAKGEPFIGRAGQLLRGLLAKASIDVDELCIMNTVSCFPAGTPTRDHVNACSSVRAAQLEVADPEWVLSLGGVALSSIRPDLKISRVRGHVLVPPGPRWFVTFHPSYAMRNPKMELRMLADLRMFRRILDGEHWTRVASSDCVVCGTDEEAMADHGLWLRFDDVAVSYCNVCWDKRS